MMLFFDVGETLASEERWLGSWADWLGVPKSAFFAALGAMIEARRPHQELFPLFRPGHRCRRRCATAQRARHQRRFLLDDLYPDACRRCMGARGRPPHRHLRQHQRAHEEFAAQPWPLADVVGSSQPLGRRQARSRFLPALIAEAGCCPP
jgi:hypothetical protein